MVTAHGRDSLLRLDKPNAATGSFFLTLCVGCGALDVATLRLCEQFACASGIWFRPRWPWLVLAGTVRDDFLAM